MTAVDLRIGELAALAGVTTRTVRHYHAVGLLKEPPRDGSGYRRYNAEDLSRLCEVRELRALDMTIAQIATILENSSTPSKVMPGALTAQAHEVNDRISALLLKRRELLLLVGSAAALPASILEDRPRTALP